MSNGKGCLPGGDGGRAKTGKCNGRISHRTDSVKREGAQETLNTAAPPRDGRDAGAYTRPR
eukprot:1081376-Pleurochrysis_carterae.AAC.1